MNNRIFSLIEELGITQSEFAEQTGISPAALSQLKNKAGNLSVDNIMKVKNAFPKLSFNWLLQGELPMWERTNDSQEPNLFSAIETKPYTPESYEPKKTEIPVQEIQPEKSTPAPQKVEPLVETPKVQQVIEKIIERPVPVERKVNKVIIFYDDGKFEELSND